MPGSIDLIILAAIAVFIVLRLYKVLGQRTGHERPHDPFAPRPAEDARSDKVIPLPGRGPRPDAPADLSSRPAEGPKASPASAILPGLGTIHTADPSFDPDSFLAGVRAAFEIIVGAFAAGDVNALRPLLNDEVFDNFKRAIEGRAAAKETLQTTLVGIKSTDIIEAELEGRVAEITVSIVSEQINVTRNAEGQVVDGDPSKVEPVTDIWTFARHVRARDPNWLLIATRSPN
ncbi:MAG TPA: Tim44/TimA family putative adaptor protein [Dongiaceae bacterium]|jgi:predicted lipid-binding transport protein (Tim44 family)